LKQRPVTTSHFDAGVGTGIVTNTPAEKFVYHGQAVQVGL
jgi:hypothetical protein